MESIFSFLDFPQESVCHRKCDRQYSVTRMNSTTRNGHIDHRVTKLSESSFNDFGSNLNINDCVTKLSESSFSDFGSNLNINDGPINHCVTKFSESSFSDFGSNLNINDGPINHRVPKLSESSLSDFGLNSNINKGYRVTRFSDSSSSDSGSSELISTKCETVYERSVSHTVTKPEGFLEHFDRKGTSASSESNLRSLARSETKRNITATSSHARTSHSLQTSRRTWAFFPRVACTKCKDLVTQGNNDKTVCSCGDRSLEKHHDEVWLTLKDINGVGCPKFRLKDRDSKSSESEEEEEIVEEDNEGNEEDTNKVEEPEDNEVEEEQNEDNEVEEEEEEYDSEDEGGQNEDYIVEEVDDSDTSSVSSTTSSTSDDDDYRSCVEVEELPFD